MFVIGDIYRAVQARDGLELEGRAILAGDFNGDLLARLEAACKAHDIIDLVPGQAERLLILVGFELDRKSVV